MGKRQKRGGGAGERKKKWGEKKVRGDVPPPCLSPDRLTGRNSAQEAMRAAGESRRVPFPAGGRRRRAAGAGGRAGDRRPPHPRASARASRHRAPPRGGRRKWKSSESPSHQGGRSRRRTTRRRRRRAGGGSRRGYRGAGGSAPPPPDSLPRKPEKVLHRVLCQAPRRHRAAGRPPSPSGCRRGRPGTRSTRPTLPSCTLHNTPTLQRDTLPGGSCGEGGWQGAGWMRAGGYAVPGVVGCPPTAPRLGATWERGGTSNPGAVRASEHPSRGAVHCGGVQDG